MLKYMPDAWTFDPEEVKKVESTPWLKFIRLLDDDEIKEKKLTLNYLPIDKVKSFSTLFLLREIYFHPRGYDDWFIGTFLSDEAYKIVKKEIPEILVLLGCDNGH